MGAGLPALLAGAGEILLDLQGRGQPAREEIDRGVLDVVGVILAERTDDGSIGRPRRFDGFLPGDAAVPAPLSIRTDRDAADEIAGLLREAA